MKARSMVMTIMNDNEDKGKGKNIDSNYDTDADITQNVNTGVFSYATQHHIGTNMMTMVRTKKTRAKTDLFMNQKE